MPAKTRLPLRPIPVLVAACLATTSIPAPGQAIAPLPPQAAGGRPAYVEVERSGRDIERSLADVEALRWSALAQAGEFDVDFDFDPDGPSFAFIAHEFGAGGEIVKNAPYQAEAVSETVQALADGNRIVRRSSTLVARDGLGRTRQERKGGTAYLVDPIERRSYALNTERRTATRIPRAPALAAPPAPPAPPSPPSPPSPPVGAAPPGPAGQPAPPPGPGAGLSRDAQRVIVRREPDGREIEVAPGRVVVKRTSEREGQRHDEVHVEVFRIGRDGPPARGAIAPLPPLALPIVPRGKGETRGLGTRDFDGVKADGTMTTHTIPAGEIGNEKPIIVTSERWFSPELHVVVYAKHADPRIGDTIYRLSGIRRGEPPAELFKVPADYRLQGDTRRR